MNEHKLNNRHLVTAVLSILVILVSSCNAIPSVVKIETGPTQTVDIQVPMPEDPSPGVELNLEFVAGQLKLSPGASGILALGTATFNAMDFKPQIETSGNSYTLRTGDMKIEGIPKCPEDVENVWDLQLADTPMTLSIKAGAYDGIVELGGLSLEKLAISDGGSNFTGTFSEPNHVVMSSFTYNTGASSTKLSGLANANFVQMDFNAGAGEYTLSFDGDLQRDSSVVIESGASTVTVIVPEGVKAQVTFDGGLTSINKTGGWEQNGKVYQLQGNGAALDITIKMGMGELNLATE